ncbi:unnamed protein product [Sphagnum jensenii]|uniref:DNA-directed RNA polymerase III subunit RPC9 n=1 Tax=Sphagnum jensenii TaxID=128206 RepID=A0ABP1AWR0_9BRYO
MEFPDVGAQKELAHRKNKITRTTRTRVIAIIGTGEDKSQLSKRALEQQQHESVRNFGLEANAGLLTNCEALQLLQSRGADKGFGVTAAECKVYDYLVKTPAGSQTREGLQEFFKGAEEYKLTKAEYLQASNLRPSTAVEVHLIVEDCDERLSSALVDQFLGMIDETLPPPPELLEDAEAQKEEAVIKADEEDGGSGQ